MLEIPDETTENIAQNNQLKIKKPSKKTPLIIIAIILLGLGLFLGIKYFVYISTHESTDNAFIDGHIVQISPKISGIISKVYVDDNQKVKKGDLLVEIDSRDFQAKIDEAQASLIAAIAKQKGAKINVKLTDVTSLAGLNQAKAGIDFSKSNIQVAREQIAISQSKLEESQADVDSAKANAKLAHQDLKRFQNLYGLGAVSKQQLDTAIANSQAADAKLIATNKTVASNKYLVKQAEAQLNETFAGFKQSMEKLNQVNTVPENVEISKSQFEVSKAEITRLQAAFRQAELNLSYTKIYAPTSGYATRKVAEKGAYVQSGQALMAIVPDNVWVTANFKETQLTHMKIGQPVIIKIDAYPNKRFKGHVDSIQYGTGARFSLLPPENAVGSYVKVVQRVPVKIIFDKELDSRYVLAPGMSVVPEVKVK